MDRACIDAARGDAQQRAGQITPITRMKSQVCGDATEGLPIAADPANDGVLRDLRVTWSSSRATWRLIAYRARRGGEWPCLTNDCSRLPGMVACRYLRRWAAEKCCDT